MASVLRKRIPRELKNNLGRYLGMFLLFVVSIMMVTGFLSAASSIERIIGEMHEKYNVQDAYFTTSFEAPESALAAVENLGATVYREFYRDVELVFPDGQNISSQESGRITHVRVYENRTTVDLAAYASGKEPARNNEIALDRVFCQNNGIEVGTKLLIGGKEFTVSGIMTLPDYTCLFEDNTDFMFNAQTFTVSQVTPQAFEELVGNRGVFKYAVILDNRNMELKERVDLEEDMIKALGDHNAVVTDFSDWESNQGIMFATDDVGGDQLMWEVLMFMLIVIMAFVFVVLTGATIEEESSVIGTLLASGYRKGELIRHYLTVPLLVGLSGCVIGNILGYSFMTIPMKDLYYGSYGLPPYTTYWNPRVFVLTTVIPLALLIFITLFGLMRKLRATPLQFLRHEVGHVSHRGEAQLPQALSFPVRFRIRVFLRNLPHFVTLFFGIAFGSILLLMGLCILPSVNHYADESAKQVVAKNMYILKTPVELEGTQEERDAYIAYEELLDVEGVSALYDAYDKGGLLGLRKELSKGEHGDTSLLDLMGLVTKASSIDQDAHVVNTLENTPEVITRAEKFAMATFEVPRRVGGKNESVTVYGIARDSAYWQGIDVSSGHIAAGNGLAQKCALEAGKTYTFTDKYKGVAYDLTIDSLVGNDADMCVYMDLEKLNDLLGNEPDSKGNPYFNGYASDAPLELDERFVAGVITPDDYIKMADQLRDSIGRIMNMMIYMVIPLYFILIYLLTKTVIDRSAVAISRMKVFGYHNGEVNKLYVRAITITVIASIILCLPLLKVVVDAVMVVMMSDYGGNIKAYLPLDLMAKEAVIGIATYAVVALFHIWRIRKIDLVTAMKAQE